MGFTEVAFELADQGHPLCRLTRPPLQAHVVYRTLDTGELHRRHRAHVTYRGPPEGAVELVRELRSLRPDSSVEVIDQTATDMALLVETPLEVGQPAGLAALPGVLAQNGLVGMIDPIVASEGRVRVRLVIPRKTEAPEILRALQDAPRACGFSDFRVQRIGAVTAAAHVEAARRALPPEQEALLALAASMGYYETPKLVTLEEIARRVGLSISPVHKRLKAAEETIVGQHVAPAATDPARRRPRASAERIDGTGPTEIVLRIHGDVGPAAFLAQTPGARGSLHYLSGDGGRTQASILVVVAPEEAQTKLLASLEDRAEIANAQLVERTSEHVVCRILTRDRGAYALGWWGDAWGGEAALRTLVFDGDQTHLRALVARPMSLERLQQRLHDCAHGAGWREWDLVSLRPLGRNAHPVAWPEPLTQRQLEVLRVAHALGYYRTPRGCTLEHVARTLGVSANAIHKNLVLAESKLISAYLVGGL